MRRHIDEDAPTIEWAKPARRQAETPLGGVELAFLQSKESAAWDAQTVAVRFPVEQEGPSRLVAMSVAALLSFVIGLATFMIVMRLQGQARADAQATAAVASMSLAGAPLVQEGVPIPSPMPGFGLSMPSTVGFVPTGDVLAPPDPRLPEGSVLTGQAPAFPIVPSTSMVPTPRASHAAPVSTVRKGKKPH